MSVKAMASSKSIYTAPKDDEAEDTITLMVHIKEKIIPIHCGFGTQQVKWIGHVAIARYDEGNKQGWLQLGVPTKITKDNGKEELRLDQVICDVLKNNNHVYVTTSLSP